MKLRKNCSEERLIKYGFLKYGTKYINRITLHRYKKSTVIEMVITVEINDEQSYITYDVLTNGDTYIPYYNNKYSKCNLVLRKVRRKVNAEIKKMKESGIIETEPKRTKYKEKKINYITLRF